MATAKTYPFSMSRAHDIEYYHNHIFNTMKDMESGEIPMDGKRYDRLEAMYYGPLMELMEAINGSRNPYVVQLTGPQIGLAKKISFWARESRAESLIKAGKTRYLQYC